MYRYRVWVLDKEYDVQAPSIYHAKAKACRLYLNGHTGSKLNWSILMSLAKVKRMGDYNKELFKELFG